MHPFLKQSVSSNDFSIIKDYKNVDIHKWQSFICEHPNGNIFHSEAMVKLYEESKCHQEVFIAYIDSEKNILGLIVGVIQHSNYIIIKPLTSRCIIWGGPLVKGNSENIYEILLKELDQTISKRVIYVQFRNLFDTHYVDNLFNRLGYEKEDHLDIIMDLTKGEDIIWKNIHSSRRKQIRRSIRRGCYVEEFNDPKEEILNKCYSLLKETYKNIGLPYPTEIFFNNAFSFLKQKNNIKAFVAFFNGEIIAFRYVLIFHNIIYDWYAASDRNHKDKYPNDLLPWHIFKWGMLHKQDQFDFGGAGKPNENYGVRDYKLKFGGELSNHGRYIKTYNRAIYCLMRFALSTYKKLR